MAAVTILPFLWIFLTAFKGPTDAVYSTSPQTILREPTLDNFARVWSQLPIGLFFGNSLLATGATPALGVLVTSLAAYPLAKIKFAGRDLISYLFLATLTV